MPHIARHGRDAVEQTIGIDESQIAHEDRNSLAVATRLSAASRPAMLGGEHFVGHRLAATTRRTVHDVVVKEGEGVQQLEGRSGVDHDGTFRIAPGTHVSPMTERWPESLATGFDQSGDLPDR